MSIHLYAGNVWVIEGFRGKFGSAITNQWGLETRVLSRVDEAWNKDANLDLDLDPPKVRAFYTSERFRNNKDKLDDVCKVVVEELGFPDQNVEGLEFADQNVSPLDADIVGWVCHLVACRAALLSGVAVAAVLLQTGHASHSAGKDINVGVDGSLIQFYPNFKEIMKESLRHLVGEDIAKDVKFIQPKKDNGVDGSGVAGGSCVGAALGALLAVKAAEKPAGNPSRTPQNFY
ncbi:hypothetical protein PM082_021293 [Marasmius tenuissimus]|nr:hypothetical protein PM082_021293 [Marasmius tenuissimus]